MHYGELHHSQGSASDLGKLGDMPTLGIDHDALARLRRQYTDCDTDSLLADQLHLDRKSVV